MQINVILYSSDLLFTIFFYFVSWILRNILELRKEYGYRMSCVLVFCRYSESHQYIISGHDDGIIRIQTAPTPGQLSILQHHVFWEVNFDHLLIIKKWDSCLEPKTSSLRE